MHRVALRFCDPQVEGSNPAEGGQGYEVFGEIALMNQRLFHLWAYQYCNASYGNHAVDCLFPK